MLGASREDNAGETQVGKRGGVARGGTSRPWQEAKSEAFLRCFRKRN